MTGQGYGAVVRVDARPRAPKTPTNAGVVRVVRVVRVKIDQNFLAGVYRPLGGSGCNEVDVPGLFENTLTTLTTLTNADGAYVFHVQRSAPTPDHPDQRNTARVAQAICRLCH